MGMKSIPPEVYAIGVFMILVVVMLGLMLKETINIQSRNGVRVKGDKLL